MTDHRHTVRRQVVEITVPPKADAKTVLDSVSRLCRTRLPAILDEQCQALADRDTILRLDRVELDLGRLPADRFETAFLNAFRESVATHLADAKHVAGSAPRGNQPLTRRASQVELLSHFIGTGTLPWWADATEPAILEATLRRLLHEAAPELVAWCRTALRKPASLHRFVQAFGLDDLVSVLRLLQPTDADLLVVLANAAATWASGASGPCAGRPHHARSLGWQAVLAAATAPNPPPDRDALLRLTLRRMSELFGVPEHEVRISLDQSPLAGPEPLGNELHQALTRLDEAQAHPAPVPSQHLLDLLDRMAHAGAPWADQLAAIRPLVASISASCRSELRALLTRIKAGAEPTPREALDRWLQASLPDPSDPSDPSDRSAFSTSDALYVQNAGLVLLWPFLERFFTHLGLLEERRFKDHPSRQRAVGLLQFLVTEERTPPEHLLPLNKMLCGMELDVVFEFGPPVTDAEQTECDRLLAAVIEQAPVLHQMSLPGFRGTFLQRRGQLTTRDGCWLLRVERETYDVVLERFPWTFQWVRLPWMTAPMQVEW